MPVKRHKKNNLPPGSIYYTGKQKVDKVSIHYLEYTEQKFKEQVVENQEIKSFHHPVDDLVQWYDIRGLHNTELINELGATFNIHPLILEDIVDVYQRPKCDEHDKSIYVILKGLSFDSEKVQVKTEQISILLGKDIVISFQEDETDIFTTLRARIQTSKGRVRKRGADYLCYVLLDTVVNQYYEVLDKIEMKVEALEADIFEADPKDNNKGKIHYLKQELLVIRKAIFPLREAISRLSKSENELITDSTTMYLRDLYDHVIHLVDMVETYRDMLNSLQDLYLSEISFKMNQVMQVLTLITSIFVPLSFIVGLYGMNFENMPELHYKYGYFVLLGVMITLVVGMLFWFKRKNWF